jgi:hypothetical protein
MILIATCFHAGILLGLLDPEEGGVMFRRNVGYSGLHGVLSQKMVLFTERISLQVYIQDKYPFVTHEYHKPVTASQRPHNCLCSLHTEQSSLTLQIAPLLAEQTSDTDN